MGNILSTLWTEILVHPILNILVVLYHLLGDNLGLAVIAFTILIRLVLLPATAKQTEMTNKMALLKPKLEELQKLYKNNQEKLASEQFKLYKEHNYNPFGCFATLVPQLILIIALYNVFRFVANGGTDGIYPFVQNFIGGLPNFADDAKFLGMDLSKKYMDFVGTTPDFFAQIPLVGKFLYEYLAAPFMKLELLPYFISAVAVAYIQFASTKFMQAYQGLGGSKIEEKKEKDPKAEASPEEMQAQMMSSMNYTFPILTYFISLTTPAVLTVAWLVQSLMIYVQYFLVDRTKFTDYAKARFIVFKQSITFNKKK
jgi:YidC/Oxa1 family membrane protein insertase